MRPRALLVNTARGAIVDTAALIRLLKTKEIAIHREERAAHAGRLPHLPVVAGEITREGMRVAMRKAVRGRPPRPFGFYAACVLAGGPGRKRLCSVFRKPHPQHGHVGARYLE